MKLFTSTLLASSMMALSVNAQEAAPLPVTETPITLTLAPAAPQFALPANTEITLSMNQEVTTRGDTWSEGDTFDLTVVNDVMLGNYVVIPRGSRGVGRITWLTSRGAFGKSGKMDIALEYVEAGGRRIPVSGTYRQEGEGNTLATVGGVILAGVFAGFITGHSGRIPQGRELVAHTVSDLPVALPAGAAPVASVTQPLTVQAPAAPMQATAAEVAD